ncbi:NADPH-dependent FMN reductase [Nocardioides jishulii]|uniref:NAD(P)H-dependent oxidoreductase n=1 Tax=Nocardioides jishulii TaxID=2575440 RepID=A0A4U2YHE6_9ACTN|nr:NAD(P)H-dependent oxidoreductase [Nocardioides jishulii]QCX26622.1 NAD(P)H-dependent oxidoreductase [Nocardioides jishulii]TKI60409.1 NAD(P)H-dependent oxidoreductase [Nocardioides jishulii]
MSSPRTVVLVGNPKPASRTLDAALLVARELDGEPDLVVDLATWGPRLLDWSDAEVAELVAQVSAARLLVVASPTYKASYTGLLKLFLDRIAGGGLVGTVAVPLMLSAAPGHAMAAETHLRPVLTELGATVPGAALSVVDTSYDDPAAYEAWLTTTRPVVTALLDQSDAPTPVAG